MDELKMISAKELALAARQPATRCVAGFPENCFVELVAAERVPMTKLAIALAATVSSERVENRLAVLFLSDQPQSHLSKTLAEFCGKSDLDSESLLLVFAASADLSKKANAAAIKAAREKYGFDLVVIDASRDGFGLGKTKASVQAVTTNVNYLRGDATVLFFHRYSETRLHSDEFCLVEIRDDLAYLTKLDPPNEPVTWACSV